MPDRESHPLDRLQPFPDEAYADVDLTGLATHVLEQLSSLNLPSTFENIVVALFRLFPAKFSLVGFPEYGEVLGLLENLVGVHPR